MTHAATATMNTKKASGTATLDGVNFSGANPAGIRNRMIIARATPPMATNISRKISSRHPARNPLGPIITAGRPIVLLSIIVSFLSSFDRTNWLHPPPFILRKGLPQNFVGRCKVVLSRLMDTLTSFSRNMRLKRSIPFAVRRWLTFRAVLTESSAPIALPTGRDFGSSTLRKHSTAPNVGGVGVRHIKRQANCFDREFGKTRQTLASVSLLVQPIREFRRIPLPYGIELLSLSS